MTFLRRSLVALGIAAMLPTVVFAAFTVFHMLRLERERVSNAALAQSQVVMTLADTQLQRHLAALDVYSPAPSISRRRTGASSTRGCSACWP